MYFFLFKKRCNNEEFFQINFVSLSLSLVILIGASIPLFAVDCPTVNPQNWTCPQDGLSFTYPCSNTPPIQYCDIWCSYCFTLENGIFKVFLTDYSYVNCSCPNKVEEGILFHIFNTGVVKTALGVNQAGTYTGIEFYTKNCVKLLYLTSGPYTYNVVGCEGSSCCLHKYSVTYEASCPPGVPCDDFRTASITTTDVSIPNENCEILEYPNVPIATCYPNCQNWSVTATIPPGMQKISVNEEEIIISHNNETSLQKLNSKEIDEISIINLNGEILYKTKKQDFSEMNNFLKGLHSGNYFYIYKKDNLYFTGKLLIIR